MAGSPGTSDTVGNLGCLVDHRLPDDLAAGGLGFQHYGDLGRRQDAADRAEGTRRLFDAAREVAGRRGHGGDEQIAESVTRELALREAELEGVTEGRGVGQERPDAAPQVPGGGNAEQLPEPSARAPVIGDRHDRGQLAGIEPAGTQRLGEPMAAPDGDHLRGGCRRPRAHRSMSRWWTTGS